MITTEMKWRTVEEMKPEPDTPVLVCSKCCEVDEGLYDEEDNSWCASSGYPLMFEVWMWAEISCPDGKRKQESACLKYQIMSEHDGNDTFEVEADSSESAAFAALFVLGWGVSSLEETNPPEETLKGTP